MLRFQGAVARSDSDIDLMVIGTVAPLLPTKAELDELRSLVAQPERRRGARTKQR